MFYLSVFHSKVFFVMVMFRFVCKIGSYRHRKSISKEICKAENQDDTQVKVCSCSSRHDSKRRNQTIYSSIDKLRKVFRYCSSARGITMEN